MIDLTDFRNPHPHTIKYIGADSELEDLESTQKDPLTQDMAPFVPTSISAIESNNISILYYARPNGELASLTSQPSDQLYQSANIILSGNTVTAAVPQVSAVSYEYKGNKEVHPSSTIR